MTERVTISDDLSLRVGRSHTALTPSEAFAVAERLIRAATVAIVTDAADRALVLDCVRDPARYRQ